MAESSRSFRWSVVEAKIDGGKGVALGEGGKVVAVEPGFRFEDGPGGLEDPGNRECGPAEGEAFARGKVMGRNPEAPVQETPHHHLSGSWKRAFEKTDTVVNQESLFGDAAEEGRLLLPPLQFERCHVDNLTGGSGAAERTGQAGHGGGGGGFRIEMDFRAFHALLAARSHQDHVRARTGSLQHLFHTMIEGDGRNHEEDHQRAAAHRLEEAARVAEEIPDGVGDGEHGEKPARAGVSGIRQC